MTKHKNSNSKPQNHAAIEEAKSHKPTFGEAAEQPVIAEPEGDPTIPTINQELSHRKNDGQEESKPFNAKEPEDHTEASPETVETLDQMRLEQTRQINPDQAQRDMHQSTTQDVLAAPKNRPKTIDPATGHIHYVSEAAALPGGTAAKGGD